MELFWDHQLLVEQRLSPVDEWRIPCNNDETWDHLRGPLVGLFHSNFQYAMDPIRLILEWENPDKIKSFRSKVHTSFIIYLSPLDPFFNCGPPNVSWASGGHGRWPSAYLCGKMIQLPNSSSILTQSHYTCHFMIGPLLKKMWN